MISDDSIMVSERRMTAALQSIDLDPEIIAAESLRFSPIGNSMWVAEFEGRRPITGAQMQEFLDIALGRVTVSPEAPDDRIR